MSKKYGHSDFSDLTSKWWFWLFFWPVKLMSKKRHVKNDVYTIKRKRCSGWRPSKVSPWDRHVKVNRLRGSVLPDVYDPRGSYPPCDDQGEIGSCVAHGCSGAFEQCDIRAGRKHVDYSRLFLYYIAREDPREDSGAYIPDAFEAMGRYGLCEEKLWPYIPSVFSVRPNDECYQAATSHQALEYARVNNTRYDLKSTLAAGYPIVFGMELYGSFDDVGKNGLVKFPNAEKEFYLGGHCMLIVGYTQTHYIVRNSWGPAWGDGGYCYIPYKLVESGLCSDFWILKAIEDGTERLSIRDCLSLWYWTTSKVRSWFC